MAGLDTVQGSDSMVKALVTGSATAQDLDFMVKALDYMAEDLDSMAVDEHLVSRENELK